ncbi:hypothetical protein H312_01849 [Anncaliia algerae PRA339]|uniref:CID domain-containing protein n=1 Tax=Anncaliia algerae PRA339 TaxID=1288291 RepID=A0A059F0P7_9MICR|nr:hypothetical protein H312_01849 [Anncaliia algerae PRA339]
MKTISKEYLLTSFKLLSLTQREMQTLSLYILTNKIYYDDILECYYFVYNKSGIFHKLLLYYLANEIFQNEKKYQSQLYKQLREFVCKYFYDDFESSKKCIDLHKKYIELKNVWITKQIYENKELTSKSINETL